jgi:lipoprotein-anchoring transpeptidase ErfK/SrfK
VSRGRAITFAAHHRFRIVAIVVLVVAAALLAFEFVTAPRILAVTPRPGSSQPRDSLLVSVALPGAERLHALSVSLDGRDVTPVVRNDAKRLYFTTGHLAQGPHTVRVTARTSDLLRLRLSKIWRFDVDTVTPTLTLSGPRGGAVVTTDPVALGGTTEPGAVVLASAGTKHARTRAGADGAFAVALPLPDGHTSLSITATDRAGNAASLRRSFLVDATPPQVIVSGVEKVESDDTPQADVIATDAAGTPFVKMTLDGQRILAQLARSQIRIPFDKLPEGLHTLVVTATDRGGHVTVDRRRFLVDSTEKLGKATLVAGARGRDVRALQHKLRTQGYYHGRFSGVLNKATVTAVRRFQTAIGIPADGIVGPEMLGGLSGRIVVVQSQHRLYFYSNGKLKKVYPVATGQWAYPTPNGVTRVVWMTKNPTWTPPDSPWAAGATAVAPGPNNPVGMRWIGTGFSGVGIHGVPSSEDWSIGTYASHGCIRMHEWDVEELYSWVAVGMPIIIKP